MAVLTICELCNMAATNQTGSATLIVQGSLTYRTVCSGLHCYCTSVRAMRDAWSSSGSAISHSLAQSLRFGKELDAIFACAACTTLTSTAPTSIAVSFPPPGEPDHQVCGLPSLLMQAILVVVAYAQFLYSHVHPSCILTQRKAYCASISTVSFMNLVLLFLS